MQLVEVEITGFRGYGESLKIPIDACTTTIIGRNDAGKSTLLEALDIFLGGTKPDIRDFTVDGDQEIEIACTFTDLPDSVVIDATRTTALADEYLLTRDGHLKLIKSWKPSKLSTPTIAAWAYHPNFEDGTDLINSKLTELKSIVTKRSVPASEIGDRRTSSDHRAAIWKTCLENNSAQLIEKYVSLSSEDGKSVAAALANYLPTFQLFKADRQGDETDKVAQDPATAVIKAVLGDHADQLSALSTTIQEKISLLLEEVVEVLTEVAPQVANSLSINDPMPSWAKAFSGLQFVDENGVPLSKRGSGTRRLVLLSFFRATAEKALRDQEQPSSNYHRGVITAVEEPETALHADLQTEILTSLMDIGELPHRQVLLTTHSANLIRLVPIESIRYLSLGNSHQRVCTIAESAEESTELLNKLNESLGIFSDHNVRCFILVEGRNDITGLKNLSQACEVAGISGVQSFSSLEASGLVCFLPIGGGGSAALWNSNLSPFRRHEIYVMDSDRLDESTKLKPEMAALLETRDDKRAVYILDSREMENYLTEDSIAHAYADLSGFIDHFQTGVSGLEWKYLDVPTLAATSAHEVNPSTTTLWADLDLNKQASKESRAKKRLASAFSHDSVPKKLEEDDNDLLDILREITRVANL